MGLYRPVFHPVLSYHEARFEFFNCSWRRKAAGGDPEVGLSSPIKGHAEMNRSRAISARCAQLRSLIDWPHAGGRGPKSVTVIGALVLRKFCV